MAIKKFFLKMVQVIKRKDDHSVQVAGFANEIFDSKILHLQGLVSGVPHETKLIAVQLTHHANKTYILPFKLSDLIAIPSGSVQLYATNDNGSQVMGAITLTNDGKLSIATETDDLLAIIKDLLVHLKTLKTFGSPSSQAPLPDWLAEIAKIEERLNSLAIYK